MRKEYRVFKDGDMWWAVDNENFSLIGFGITPMVALGDLVMSENEANLKDEVSE